VILELLVYSRVKNSQELPGITATLRHFELMRIHSNFVEVPRHVVLIAREEVEKFNDKVLFDFTDN
jgi:hypothetical protein